MNFKDRGNKKWNSLMLVEHQKKLKQLKMQEADVEKPELDQQELKEINFKIEKALNQNLTVRIKFYENKRIKNIKGPILKIDKYKRLIKIDKQNKKIVSLNFDQIIELEF